MQRCVDRGCCFGGLDLLQTFMFYGQPRTVFKGSEKDPLGEVTLTLDGSGVRVRSIACLGFLSDGQGLLSCKVCRRASMLPSFRAHIAKKAYFIDLIVLSWKLFHCSEKNLPRPCSEQTTWLLDSPGRTCRSSSRVARISWTSSACHRAICVPSHRRSESFQKFLDSYLVMPHMFCADSSEAAAHGALASSLARGVAQGTVRALDLHRNRPIATGRIVAIHHSIIPFHSTPRCEGAWPQNQQPSRGSGSGGGSLGGSRAPRRGGRAAGEVWHQHGCSTQGTARIAHPPEPMGLSTDRPGVAADHPTVLECPAPLLCGQRSYVLVDETVWCPN